MVPSKTKRLKSPNADAAAAGQDCRQSAGPGGYCPEGQPAAADYAGLDFKEMLAACPLEGIDLARERELPRDVALLG